MDIYKQEEVWDKLDTIFDFGNKSVYFDSEKAEHCKKHLIERLSSNMFIPKTILSFYEYKVYPSTYHKHDNVCYLKLNRKAMINW